jgi:hypothetical protein
MGKDKKNKKAKAEVVERTADGLTPEQDERVEKALAVAKKKAKAEKAAEAEVKALNVEVVSVGQTMELPYTELSLDTPKKQKKAKKAAPAPEPEPVVEPEKPKKGKKGKKKSEPVEVEVEVEEAPKKSKKDKGKKKDKNPFKEALDQVVPDEPAPAPAAPARRGRTPEFHKVFTELNEKVQETGEPQSYVIPKTYKTSGYGDKVIKRYQEDPYNFNITAIDVWDEEDEAFRITATIEPTEV